MPSPNYNPRDVAFSAPTRHIIEAVVGVLADRIDKHHAEALAFGNDAWTQAQNARTALKERDDARAERDALRANFDGECELTKAAYKDRDAFRGYLDDIANALGFNKEPAAPEMVAAIRGMANSRDGALADLDTLHQMVAELVDRTGMARPETEAMHAEARDAWTLAECIDRLKAERDAALARVAALEAEKAAGSDSMTKLPVMGADLKAGDIVIGINKAGDRVNVVLDDEGNFVDDKGGWRDIVYYLPTAPVRATPDHEEQP